MDMLKDYCRKIRALLRASKIVAGKELRRLYTLLADNQWLEKKKTRNLLVIYIHYYFVNQIFMIKFACVFNRVFINSSLKS